MRVVVVAAVLLILLAFVVGLESAPSARDEAEARAAVERQVKRELDAFERALFADDDHEVRYRRGWFKKLKKKLKNWWNKNRGQVVSTAVQAGAKYLGGGKRDAADFQW